jgi:enoyl-CoA hydratase/carnithine racemase
VTAPGGTASGAAPFAHLRIEHLEGRVALVTIDRPEVLNAADVRLHRELSEVWAVLDADDRVAASVITGAGRAFSAGGDL